MSNIYIKRPHEVLDYTVDFSRWLSDGDTILTATGSIAGGTAAINVTSHTSTSATAWVSGGADGENCDVTVQIVTAQGRTKEQCFKLRVKDGC